MLSLCVKEMGWTTTLIVAMQLLALAAWTWGERIGG